MRGPYPPSFFAAFYFYEFNQLNIAAHAAPMVRYLYAVLLFNFAEPTIRFESDLSVSIF
jgi:hypothetical protein